MFAYLFSSIIEFLFVVGLAVVVYQVFLSDWVRARRLQVKESQVKFDSIDKIAQVKLVSDDAKDIEDFITKNAQYLSNEVVKRLVDRIEAIKTDQIISADTILKKRIDALEQPIEVEEEPAVVKRASRRK